MANQHYLQLVKHLASGIGLKPSDTTVKQHKGIDTLLYNGNTGPEIIGIKLNKIGSLTLYLPYVEGTTPYVPFSQNVLGDFKLNNVVIYYERDVLPEFNEVVEELRQTRRIPIEELSHVSELAINRLGDNSVYGSVSYRLGTPPLKKLCMLVDPGLKEFVPEAEKQPDQDHDCIHGRSVPFIPFKPSKFSSIGIKLDVVSNEGYIYLKKFLDGLPVQQDLILNVNDDNGIWVYRNPFYHQFEVRITNPENKENVDNVLTLIRRIEEMFRGK